MFSSFKKLVLHSRKGLLEWRLLFISLRTVLFAVIDKYVAQ